jgi:hypothetical protein
MGSYVNSLLSTRKLRVFTPELAGGHAGKVTVGLLTHVLLHSRRLCVSPLSAVSSSCSITS